MTLTLPYPPSANRYWRVWRGRAVKSDKAREYQRAAVLMAKARLGPGFRPLVGALSVYLCFYRPAKRGDLDNSLKVLLDALRGIAYVDDSQIVELCARRFDDKSKAGVFVSIMEVVA